MSEKKKILIVDDKPEIRRLVQLTLQDTDYEFYEAADGVEALNKVYEIKPDLILLDVMMPGKDGYEVLRELRSDSQFDNTVIVMLTAKGQEVDVHKALSMGANEHFAKPFSPTQLIKKLEEYLKNE